MKSPNDKFIIHQEKALSITIDLYTCYYLLEYVLENVGSLLHIRINMAQMLKVFFKI